MADYIEYTFVVNPVIPGNDLLMAELAELPFESFVEFESGVKGYIPINLCDVEQVYIVLNSDILNQFNITTTYQTIPHQNWNAEWEKNFEPIIVSDNCVIRAPFHSLHKQYIYDVIINPKMAFGTGHHQTTFLICQEILNMNWENKVVLDMGCGTGILAILIHKLGSTNIDAIDIDIWSVENTKENYLLNAIDNENVFEGDALLLNDKAEKYDVVIANINKNILKQDSDIYYKALKNNGQLLLSGFFELDNTELISLYEKNGFAFVNNTTKDEWSMLVFEKKN